MKNLKLFLMATLSIAIFFLSCKKDPDIKTEKLMIYLLLCPNGADACYNDCANSSGISDGTITGVEFNQFSTCKSQCDAYCNTSFLLIKD
jgi:hypothetical protein